MALITGSNGIDHVDTVSVSAGVTGGPATVGDDTIQGLGGLDFLSGGPGHDLIDGGDGDGYIYGSFGDDTLLGGVDNDHLYGEDGNDLLVGGDGDDYLSDSSGQNTLIGGAGRDRFSVTNFGPNTTLVDGGDGDDTFLVAGAAMTTLTGGAGADRFVISMISYSPAGAPIGVVTDFEAGNGGDVLDVAGMLSRAPGYTGGDPFSAGYMRLRQVGANTILDWDGDGGGDSFSAALNLLNTQAAALTVANFNPGFAPVGATITGSSSADRIVMAGVSAGVTGGPPTDLGDTISVASGNDVVVGGAGADSIQGGEGADTLNGVAGNDTLDGGAGIDRLIGGIGDDLYVVTAGDVVVEGASQGIDTVRTAVATYVLVANVEHLAATNDTAHRFIGNALDNTITGGGGADTLFGLDGNDTLDGGAGVDRLIGGVGDDFYAVTVGDVIVEGANQGTDTALVNHAGTYRLTANVENAVLSGGLAISAVGTALANSLTGNAASNILYGLGGGDTLSGGGGNDVLIGGAGGDVLLGGGGNDQFRLSAITDSTLAAPDVIVDFTFRRGIEMDRLDLRMIDANAIAAGDQAFAYRGAEFTGAAGDLRVQSAGAGSYIAAGDTNGDGIADVAITIRSEAAPEAAWFLL